MPTQIFVNLPVKDLQKSIAFFTAVGYTFNPQFTDEAATCMIISDNIYVMLLTEPRFQEFTAKSIADAHTSTEVITCLSCENRGQVDEIVGKALAAGGQIYAEPKDYGFMYQHSFQDLDGHQWEYIYMDPAALQQS